jgi:adenylate cyclase
MAGITHVLRGAARLPPGLRLHRLARAVLVLALAAAAFLAWVLDPVPLQALRLAQFDQFQRWHPRTQAAPFVTVVDIDEASLRALGQWPWPRDRLAELVDRLAAGQPAAIGLDILLIEPDRTSPRALARTLPIPSAITGALPDYDERLAEALRGRPVAIGTSLSRGDSGADKTPPTLPARVVTRGEPSGRWIRAYDGAVLPLPVLAQAAAGIGALNEAPDADGVVRRVPLLLRVGDTLVPGLALEAWRLVQGAQNIVAIAGPGGLQALRVGSGTVPSTPEGELWLHYAGAHARRTIPAAQVLQGAVQPGSLRGQVVLVGSSAAGLMDLRVSPVGDRMPGVLAQAEALEQIQAGAILQRPDWAGGLEGVLLVGLAAAVAALALATALPWAVAALAAALLVLGGGAWWAFVHGRLLLDAAVPGLMVLAVFGVAGGVQYRATEQRQRWLRTAFSRYVSPNRVAHLLRHPELLNLGGRRQQCSFVFTDLAGFTQMMERADPADAVALLNGYLDGMLDIVFRHDGTVDRIVGDAITVLFSAPIEQPDHRERALACALDLHAFARDHAARLQGQGIAWGLTRIGVHCGEVIVGNFGGQKLFDYRALGDAVNTTARLESVNKHLGTSVCVSAAVSQASPDVPVRPVGRLVLKGRSQPLEVVTPEAATGAGWAPADAWRRSFELLRAGAASDARAALEALAAAHPDDPLVALHLQRLREGAQDDVVVMAEK